jgi:hypothetical protein
MFDVAIRHTEVTVTRFAGATPVLSSEPADTVPCLVIYIVLAAVSLPNIGTPAAATDAVQAATSSDAEGVYIGSMCAVSEGGSH